MSKTNDTEKTRELNDAELAAVTGGVVNAAVAGAIKGAVWGGVSAKDDGVLPTLPCDPVNILCSVVP
jgi:lactobin A/cerein 7B family class IIb bacteriocin